MYKTLRGPSAIRIDLIEHTCASEAVNKTSPNTISILFYSEESLEVRKFCKIGLVFTLENQKTIVGSFASDTYFWGISDSLFISRKCGHLVYTTLIRMSVGVRDNKIRKLIGHGARRMLRLIRLCYRATCERTWSNLVRLVKLNIKCKSEQNKNKWRLKSRWTKRSFIQMKSFLTESLMIYPKFDAW